MKYYKKKKRIKYNWFHIINELSLSKAFGEYREKVLFNEKINHKKNISENRLARAFVHHYRRLLPLDLSWAIKGSEMPYNNIYSV